jgi:hypothetical protein
MTEAEYRRLCDFAGVTHLDLQRQRSDALCDRIDEMTAAELDAEIRAAGENPDEIVRRVRALIERTVSGWRRKGRP